MTKELADLEKKMGVATELAVDGLLTDGGHHKQWYLEEIIKALGMDLDTIREDLRDNDYDWEDGIAP